MTYISATISAIVCHKSNFVAETSQVRFIKINIEYLAYM